MFVEVNELETKFSSLNSGDKFIWNGKLYVRLDLILGHFKAVNILSGKQASFDTNEMVKYVEIVEAIKVKAVKK
jgi:hypothetical protein